MSEKKVNAKFKRTDNTDVIVHGIEEAEVVGIVGELNDSQGAEEVVINVGHVKEVELVDNAQQPIQTIYGDKTKL